MLSIKSATSMSYDFSSREAFVTYPEGTKVNMKDVQNYFDDATDGKVKWITITIGDSFTTLTRDSDRKWIKAEP